MTDLLNNVLRLAMANSHHRWSIINRNAVAYCSLETPAGLGTQQITF